jgi:2'-5' RNA ligase
VDPAPPLIVSLQLDPVLFAAADALRREHFPPERNVLAAHVTLFHQLPGDRHADVAQQLAAACDATPPLPIALPSVRSLGRGVAIVVEGDGLLRVRAELARAWDAWLTPQDRHGYRPHITVQNKVDPAVAKRLHDHLRHTWTPLSGIVPGLLLWRYRGGPWEPAGAFPFAGRHD